MIEFLKYVDEFTHMATFIVVLVIPTICIGYLIEKWKGEGK